MAARIRVLCCFLVFLPFLNLFHAIPLQTFSNLKLADTTECQNDINELCSKSIKVNNNFAVLDCLQGDLDLEKRVSPACQNLIWHYKLNLTRDDRFESAGASMCKLVLKKFPDCANLPDGSGQKIPCLLEHMDNVTDVNCHQFLNKMAKIVFSDYNMIFKFADYCKEDILRLQCGRLDNDPTQMQQSSQNQQNAPPKLHNQGQTLVCLAENIGDLKTGCKKQVLRVAELQSDDYHLDRPLYYACRDARETFCEKVHAGDGKVYKCLYKHKNDHKMPEDCRKRLTMRQTLISQDVKIEKTFYTACEKEMKTYGCLLKGPTYDDGNAARSTVLLCLENAMAKDQRLSGECVAEMSLMRKSLMSDYQITPEIVSRCGNEIKTLCAGLERGGKTLHCLMEHANPKNFQPGKVLTDMCRASLENLLQEANVGEDFSVDRVLSEACQPVLEHECQGAAKIGAINCLMQKVESEHMTDDCEDRLLEIQYFIVRDFRLDTELYKLCHKDAMEFCNAPKDWYQPGVQTVDQSPQIFPCLYRYMKDEEGELSKGCAGQIKRTMRKRAKRIDLEPEIEKECLQDLGLLCSDMEHYGKGMEIACLQDHYDELMDDCQEAVKQFTQDEDKDLDLDTMLMNACTPMIKKFCGELLEHNAGATDVMDCLIEYKNHHEMNTQCAAGIEHHQVVQLKDFSFTFAFKDACKEDVKTHCGDKKKKMDIVVCLSQLVRDDTLTGKPQRIQPTCRKQLQVEVKRRGESIDLDEDMKQQCHDDIKNYCSGKHPGNAEVIQCLKYHQKSLTSKCHMLLFKREQDESALGADYELYRDCKNMIKTYCSNRMEMDVIDCLRRNMQRDNTFDYTCKKVVMKRVMEQAQDYRLNPSLAKNCRLDIPKFCKSVLDHGTGTQGTQDTEMEGKVINCLKIQYLKKRLSRECTTEIKMVMEDGHKDINMDPVLMSTCKTQIRTYCANEVTAHEDPDKLQFIPADSGDLVEDCLEQKMKEGKIDQMSACGREISRLIEESHVDIHLDPALKAECQTDLTRWCQEVETGEGKKMSCLLSVLEDHPTKMKANCRQLLENRRALWEYAAKSAPAESLSDLSEQIMQSNSKTYLLGVLMTIVGIIFLVGMTCGRVTKRAKFHKDK